MTGHKHCKLCLYRTRSTHDNCWRVLSKSLLHTHLPLMACLGMLALHAHSHEGGGGHGRYGAQHTCMAPYWGPFMRGAAGAAATGAGVGAAARADHDKVLGRAEGAGREAATGAARVPAEACGGMAPAQP